MGRMRDARCERHLAQQQWRTSTKREDRTSLQVQNTHYFCVTSYCISTFRRAMTSFKSFGEILQNSHPQGNDSQKTSNVIFAENTRATTNTPDVRPFPFVSCCSKCLTDESQFKSKRKALMRCPACHLTRYCSKQCQKQHLSVHKSSCKRIADLTVEIELEETKLSSYPSRRGIENLFREKVGDFARYRHCQPYIQAKDTIGNAIVSLAYTSYNTFERRAEMLDVALNHFMELLRLNGPTCIKTGNSLVVPYSSLWDRIVLLLVSLHRDDEAVAMIDYFCKCGLDAEFHRRNASKSTCGDWIYTQSSRFKPAEKIGTLINDEDVSESYVDFEFNSTGELGGSTLISFGTPAVAICLLVVKLRVLLDLRLETERWKVFEVTSGGVFLDQIHCVVRAFLLGDKTLLRQQERDVRVILAHIHSTVPSIMEELLDTPQLSPHGAASRLFDGITQPEFWYLLQDCLQSSTGIVDTLFDMYGQE